MEDQPEENQPGDPDDEYSRIKHRVSQLAEDLRAMADRDREAAAKKINILAVPTPAGGWPVSRYWKGQYGLAADPPKTEHFSALHEPVEEAAKKLYRRNAITVCKAKLSTAENEVTDTQLAQKISSRWNQHTAIVRFKNLKGRPKDDALIWEFIEKPKL